MWEKGIFFFFPPRFNSLAIYRHVVYSGRAISFFFQYWEIIKVRHTLAKSIG